MRHGREPEANASVHPWSRSSPARDFNTCAVV